MAFTEDLTLFFADFGVIANGGTCTVGGASVEGIFDNEYSLLAFDIDGSKPALTCRAADVAGAARGNAVVVNGVSYTIQDIQPDGTGVTVLILEGV